MQTCLQKRGQLSGSNPDNCRSRFQVMQVFEKNFNKLMCKIILLAMVKRLNIQSFLSPFSNINVKILVFLLDFPNSGDRVACKVAHRHLRKSAKFRPARNFKRC